jgi:transcriptional activator protein Pur-alpha
MEPPERLPGLSDDVGAGFIAGHGSQSASGPEVDVERLVDLPPQEEISGMGMSKVIRADQKRFFFDLGSNNRGHYLRISEVTCCWPLFVNTSLHFPRTSDPLLLPFVIVLTGGWS